MAGSNFSGEFNATVDFHLKDKNDLVIYATCTGTKPLDANTFQKGCILNVTDTASPTSALWHNTGTSASVTWTQL